MLDIDSVKRDLQDLCSYSKRGRRETYKERVDRAFEISEPEYLMFQPDNKRGGIVKMMEYLTQILNVWLYSRTITMIWICSVKTGFPLLWGNGCQDLKDMASCDRYNVNDGIKKACEHFEWI